MRAVLAPGQILKPRNMLNELLIGQNYVGSGRYRGYHVSRSCSCVASSRSVSI